MPPFHLSRQNASQVEWDKQYVFVDAHAGHGFRGNPSTWCPCITKARGGSNGFYVLALQRFMTIHEIAGFQGLPSWVVNRLLRKGITKTHLGRALGDAMSLNVLMRHLPLALHAAGLLNTLPDDLWAEAVFTVGGNKRLPDA